jgi:flagellar biosynthesis GTPase FlhF
MDKNDIKKKINLIMALDFQINKRGSDFLLYTGVATSVLQKYEKEFNALKEFQKDGEDFIIPRSKLCDVLDVCFDHFTEDSLMRITKLLDKNDDMRDKINERSVSKRKSSKDHKERREKDEKERDRLKRERDDRERRERDERERREMAEREEREKELREQHEKELREQHEKELREQHEKELREQREKELREQREKELREEKKKQYMRDLNYEDSSQKIELLKMVSSIRVQLTQLEKYVNQHF